jgi:hypothetical protein
MIADAKRVWALVNAIRKSAVLGVVLGYLHHLHCLAN